jgi:hypothetical protein
MKKASVVTVMLACALTACQQPPVQTMASVASPACAGDEYIEVTNNTGKTIKVYADIGVFDGEYIGTMPPDSSRLSLTGTPAQGTPAVFYATADNVKYTQAYVNSPVQLTRRCGTVVGPATKGTEPK